jgi:flagella basal body P-ring formation protein FlgA
MIVGQTPATFRRLSVGLVLAALAWPGMSLCALAEDRTIPVPKEVIYPGDIIRDGMLTDISVYDAAGADGSLIVSRADIVGKAAKRTLLPGRGISAYAIGAARVVANGAQVKLIYREGPLTIVTSALALEAGAAGDMIKVRNADSGVTISGTVQSDGSVSVGDS